MSPEYDVIIAGGGMIGASLACALGNTKLRCGVIEPTQLTARQGSSYDARGIALSQSSRRILTRFDIWQGLAAAAYPIKQIHISDQGQFGVVRLRATEVHLEALGYVVAAHELGTALYQRLNALDNIELLQPATLTGFSTAPRRVTVQLRQANQNRTITARLLVAADGNHSAIRAISGIKCDTQDYRQTAIVTNITTTKINDYTAFERFTKDGSIALLPIGPYRCVCVLIVNADRSAALIDSDVATFIEYISARFQRLGKIKKISARQSYPIHYTAATEQYRQNIVLLGNAAHNIHPNTAQGFNLGLRDAAGLAAIFSQDHVDLNDIGLLRQYCQQRKVDQRNIIRFSRILTSLFHSTALPKRLLRNQIMQLLAYQPYARGKLIRLLTGLSGMQANAVCDPHDIIESI